VILTALGPRLTTNTASESLACGGSNGA
jgi:hypothetical protein